MSDDWGSIRPSNHPSELRMRRIDPDHPLDFFYGKDYQGSYILSLQGIINSESPPPLPKLAGIDVTLVVVMNDLWELQLQLVDSSQIDIFKALCSNLLEATRGIERSNRNTASIGIVLARLRRWQELIRSRRDKLLTKSQRVGLIGELLVLRDLFLRFLNPQDAVSTWRGPYGDEQDFLFGAWMVEVKTQLSSSDRKLIISSVDQLDTKSGNIVICHQTLGVVDESTAKSCTLNSLVDELTEIHIAKGSNAIDLFMAILIEFGYVRREEYDDEHYLLNERHYYHVNGSFPALTSAMMPAGVEDVNYSIKVELCQPFVVEEQLVCNWVFSN